MKKGKIITLATALILGIGSPLSLAGEQTTTVHLSTPTVTNQYQASYGDLNLKFFEVEAEEAGAYYAGLWLQPTLYADQTHTTFYVYLNNGYTGKVSTSVDGWQSATLDNGQALQLQKGTNTIAVATLAPEVPEVELVALTTSAEDAVVSSDGYDAFMAEATAGTTYAIPTGEEEEVMCLNANPTDPVILPDKWFYNVPLLYTTYRVFTLEKKTEVIITTNSETAHDLEVIYYGTQLGHNQSPPPLSGDQDFPRDPTIYELLPEMSKFAKANFNKPTSQEMQTYTWHDRSKKADNADTQLATVSFTTPKYGMYFIRVRTSENGAVGTANLRLNDQYIYQNVPITSAIVNYEIPADGNEYACLAKGERFEKDDPIIFIHREGGMLLGIDDDSSESERQTYHLSWMDSFISQKYLYEVKHISVSSYSSRNPISTCDIRARILVEDKNIARSKRGRSNGGGSLMDKDSVVVPATITLDSPLTINSPSRIRKVTAFNLYGRRTGSITVNDDEVNLSAHDLNISASGIYIVTIETENGTVSRKVFVK